MVPAIAIPALVALLVKFGLLCYSISWAAKNYAMRLVIALLAIFTLHNLVEFIGLSLWMGEVTPLIERLGFVYVALLIPAAALILHASLLLSFDLPSEDRRVRLQPLLYVPALALLYLLLATDQLVAGFQPFRSSILRVPGPLYILFESYIVVYLSAALVSLIYGARGSRKPVVRQNRNRLWLLALLPTGLLILYLIVANHFGVAKLTSTIYAPLPLTFFLAVAAYATFHCRLIDIAFFIPGSAVRKRKTELYRHVHTLVAQIPDVRSIQELLDRIAELLRCPVALIGGPRPLTATKEGEQSCFAIEKALSLFPRETLQNIERLVVADEIADSFPELHALMKRHQVGAIVPFNSADAASPHWLVLGENFSEQVYTPRDFEVIEPLFDRIAESFLESARLLHFKLQDISVNRGSYKHRLAVAWDELANLRKQIANAEVENRELSMEKAMFLRRGVTGVDQNIPALIASGEKTLEQYLADTEVKIAAALLQCCGGSETKAARLLGISPERLRCITKRLGPEAAK